MFSQVWRQRRSRRGLLLLLAISLISGMHRAWAQSEDAPTLFINHGGHTGIVRQVLFTADGKNLISVGDDKAIRVWDVGRGIEIGQPIYGQVSGDPLSDTLNCAALSPPGPDGKRLLAVAGSTHTGLVSGNLKSNRFVIRLFSLGPVKENQVDAAMVKLLPDHADSQTLGHGDSILGLAFSPDGKRLASCGKDWTVRVWDLADGKCVVLGGRTYYSATHYTQPGEHTQDVYSIAWSPQGDRIASGSEDGTVRIWNPDAQDGSDLLGDSVHGKCVNLLTVGEEVHCLAWSGKLLVAGTRQVDDRGNEHGGSVYTWDTGRFGDPVALARKDEPITCIAISPDGKMIAAGQKNTRLNDISQVLVWSSSDSGRFQEMSAYQAHPAAVTAVAFAPDSSQVASADAVGDIYLWRPNDRTVKPQMLVGAGAPTMDAAWSSDSQFVRWTAGGRSYVYDFAHALCVDAASPDVPATAGWTGGAATATTADGKSLRLDLTTNAFTVTVKGGDHDVTLTPTTPTENDTVTATAFTPDGTKAVVGSLYHLRLYDAQTGQEIKDFAGHSAKITSVSVSKDGHYLVSASNDQTVRIWRLGSSDDRIVPLLSIFASPDLANAAGLRYVAWAEGGFYACSQNGQDIIGWQRNLGDAQRASYDEAGTLPSLRNIDVIEAIWRDGDILDALQDPAVHTEVRSVESLKPPTVALKDFPDGQPTSATQISVTAHITPGSQPLKRVVFSVNGVTDKPDSVTDFPSGTAPFDLTRQVTLRKGVNNQPAKNIVTVTAYDTLDSHNTPASGTIPCTVQDTHRPVLNLLSIGIRRYERFLDLKYPDRDATQLADTLQQQEGKLFSKVNATVLVNQHATKARIESELQKLTQNQPDDNDYTIVFVAGHGGQTDTQTYWLLPFDLDSSSEQKVEDTAINWKDVYEQLRTLHGHVFLFLDTCHSAGATSAAEQARNDQDAASKSEGFSSFTSRLENDARAGDNPLIVMTSCAAGELSAEDSTLKHGLFTEALLEALRATNNPIAQKHSGAVDVKFSQVNLYVQSHVNDLNGNQQPQLLGTLTNDVNGLPLADVTSGVAKTASR